MFRTFLKRVYEESTPRELINFIERNGMLMDKKMSEYHLNGY